MIYVRVADLEEVVEEDRVLAVKHWWDWPEVEEVGHEWYVCLVRKARLVTTAGGRAFQEVVWKKVQRVGSGRLEGHCCSREDFEVQGTGPASRHQNPQE